MGSFTASRRFRCVLVVLGPAAVLGLGACVAGASAGDYIGDAAVASMAEELREEGRSGYYLGPEANGLALTHVDRVTENGPDFQFWASYGRCQVGMFEEGGCADPLSVGTRAWRADVTGISCQRLEPQLGVPAGRISGELTLFTGDVLVSVLPVEDATGRALDNDLELLADLRAVGADRPAGSLPPPVPDLAAWVDTTCGSTPGETVEHPIEGEGAPLDNTHVPDFTVDALGGGQLAWADHRGRPVIVAVGSLDQVLPALDRLVPLGAASPSRPAVVGLVVELDADKRNPRPLADLEREAGDAAPAPVGYAAVPLPAVWFLDAAANVGEVDDGMASGVIAFVDAAGEVMTYVPMDASDARLGDAARRLG
jgi:hypothetical protein